MGANDGFTPDNKGTEKEQVPTPPGHVRESLRKEIIVKQTESGNYLAWYAHRDDIIANGETSDAAMANLSSMYLTVLQYEHDSQRLPLTHHQQAVKDFMVAMVIGVFTNMELAEQTNQSAKKAGINVSEFIAEGAKKYADAFINQIKTPKPQFQWTDELVMQFAIELERPGTQSRADELSNMFNAFKINQIKK